MSRFRTNKISDSRFESDHLRFITVKTANLKGRGDICVYVPPNVSQNDLPLCILLHGVYGSSWSWAFNAGAHLTAQRLIEEGKISPMVLAMPSDGLWGDGSGYLAHNTRDFEKWIVEDVTDAIKLNIEEASKSTSQFIAGLSMGGFGALRIGAKYGYKFKAFSGHSAITSLNQMNLFVEESLDEYTQPNTVDEDVFLTMKENKNKLPPFRFDCGKDDLLIEYNRKLHTRLTEVDISHDYEEFEGMHEWPYWEEHIVDSLLFFNSHI